MSQTQRSALRAIVNAVTGRGKRGLNVESSSFSTRTTEALLSRGLITTRVQRVRGGKTAEYFIPTLDGIGALA